MTEVVQIAALTSITIVLTCLMIVVLDNLSQVAPASVVRSMNREIVAYPETGWIVLIDLRHRVVGLYRDQLAVSHARIRIGSDVVRMVKDSEHVDLTIGDFRKLDVEIPRFSYRVLYEYKVPHETRVIFY